MEKSEKTKRLSLSTNLVSSHINVGGQSRSLRCIPDVIDGYYFVDMPWLPAVNPLDQQPSHLLRKQPGKSSWCALVSLLNGLDNWIHCQRVLGIKRRAGDMDEKLEEKDFEKVEFVLRKELGIKTKGLGPGDIWMYFHAMQGPGDLDIRKWIFKRRPGLTVLNLLLFDINKAGNSYILFGRTTSNDTLRRKSSNVLLMRTWRGNKYHSPHQPNQKLRKRKILDTVRAAEKGWRETHKGKRFEATGGNSQPHAICVKFNAFGIPFRYDPGNEFIVLM